MAKNKNPPPVVQKSAGHACFARMGPKGHDRIGPELAGPGDVEFYVDDAGTCLCRAPIEAEFSGPRRTGVAVLTGILQIRDACRALGCRVPDATAKEEEKRAAAYAARHPKSEDQVAAAEAAATKPKPAAKPAKKERQIMKGKTLNLNLVDAWEKLFIDNEKAAKKNKQTDEQLIKVMRKEFPEAGESTTGRPRMYRSCYNAGTYMYLKRDKAGTKDRPLSSEYNADGEPVVRSRGAKPGEKKPAKPAADAKTKAASKPKAKVAAKSAAKPSRISGQEGKQKLKAKPKAEPKPKGKSIAEKNAAAEKPFVPDPDGVDVNGGIDN